MNLFHRELTLDEILSESIVRALMEADGVDPQDLAAALRLTGRKLIRRAERRRGQIARLSLHNLSSH
jgi:hypothetical protein